MQEDEDQYKPTVHFKLHRYSIIETPLRELVRLEIPHSYRPSSNRSHAQIACSELCVTALDHLDSIGIHKSKEAQLEAIVFIIALSLKQAQLDTEEDKHAYIKLSCDNCLKGFGNYLDEHHALLLIKSRTHYYEPLDDSGRLSYLLFNLCMYSEKKGVFTSMNRDHIIFNTQGELGSKYLMLLTQQWIKDIVKSKLVLKLARTVLYMQKKPLNIEDRSALNDIEYAPSLLDSVITTAKSGKARFQKLNNAFKDLPYLPHLIAVMLLLAWLDMPYGYYMFLRLSVAAYAVFCFIQHLHSTSRHRELFLILSAGVALLYQPIIKVPLEREIWQWVNLVSIALLYIATPKHRKNHNI